MNDPPYRRGRNFLRNYFPPEFYVGDSRYSAASNPPHAANPASMRPPFATGGLCPTLGASTCIIYPSSAVSLQNNSSIGIGSTLCSANSHAVSPMVQSPAAINHPFGSYEPLQGPPRFPQSLVLGSSAPICPSDFSTTPSISGETTTAVSSRNVLPDPGYVPSETRVISSSNRTLQLVGEHNYCFPQPLLTTSVAAVPSSSSSGDAISVPCEAAVIPLSSSSTCMSPTSASGNSLQGSQQPPSSTNGQFPTFPSALDVSDSEPAVCSNTYSAQPKLNSYCSSVSKSLDNALADLHLTEASCAQPHPQSESPDNAPVTLISSLQPAAPTSTSINPPLAGAETTAEATANSITGTGILVKATHVSPETQPSNVDYNPPETTAIPSPEPQSDLTASKHLEFGANAVSLAAATKSDPSLVSLTESGAPTTLKTTTSEANSTVHLSSSQMVANSTLNPPQGANNTLPPISSSLPHPSQQITTVSTPQAMATKLEPKAEPSTIPPLSFNIPPIHGNSAAGAAAGPMPGMHPPHQVRNDQWTSYQHNRIRIPHRMNPRDLKYKQVSTRHKCSGSTIGADIVPQLNDHFRNTKLKLHEVHHQVSSLGNQRESESPEFDLGYDMMEVSSEEEEEGED